MAYCLGARTGRLKDGTNRDESTGTGLAGVVEADAGWDADAETGGREDGSDGALGAGTAWAAGGAWGRGGGAPSAGPTIEPQDRGGGSSESVEGPDRARLA